MVSAANNSKRRALGHASINTLVLHGSLVYVLGVVALDLPQHVRHCSRRKEGHVICTENMVECVCLVHEWVV